MVWSCCNLNPCETNNQIILAFILHQGARGSGKHISGKQFYQAAVRYLKVAYITLIS